jgi:3',5'-cyclic AMP phosphodiesterase CpdA
VWAPGNHELWTHPADPVQLRGEQRYQHLVAMVRALGAVTPEDPFPIWPGEAGPVVIAPLFLLYDYSFHPPGTASKADGLAYAYETGVVCADEHLLHADPYPSREAWCAARLATTRRRLDAIDASLPTILVNHFPLIREPTRVLRYPEFAQWCGTVQTADWHRRYRARAVVYGHLHIPRRVSYDGVPFIESSVGYPREWHHFGGPLGPRQVLPPRPEAQ